MEVILKVFMPILRITICKVHSSLLPHTFSLCVCMCVWCVQCVCACVCLYAQCPSRKHWLFSVLSNSPRHTRQAKHKFYRTGLMSNKYFALSTE